MRGLCWNPLVAVDKVSFGIKVGECFTLLGVIFFLLSLYSYHIYNIERLMAQERLQHLEF